MAEAPKRAGRPRKVKVSGEAPEPLPKEEGATGLNTRGRQRAVTKSEADPWQHDETTVHLPKVLHNDWAQLMLGDCHKLIQQLPDASVDLLYCDPPFSITMAKWDDGILWPQMWPHIWRVLKPNGAVVLHASQPFTFDLVASQREHFKYAWTWKKPNKTLFPKAKVQPLRQVEQICVFYRKQCTYNPQMVKGKPHLRGQPGHSQYYGDAFKRLGSSVSDEYYPTDFIDFPLNPLLDFLKEKDIQNFPFEEFSAYLRAQKVELPFPTELLYFQVRSGRSFSRMETMAEYFVRTYSEPGEVVLDICCSDGTTGAACRNTGRKFIGIDLSPQHYKLAGQRLGLLETPAE